MMKSVKPWVSGLGVSTASYEAWLRDLPSQESITYWCLATGKIKADAYLAWAREQYGLAVLNSAYFQRPANSALWSAIQSVANWSEQMIPIQDWDGVVFIACVEPHSDVTWSFPVQYVLASSTDLKKYWSDLHNANIQATAPVIAEAPPKKNALSIDAILGGTPGSFDISVVGTMPNIPSAESTATTEPVVIVEPVALEEPAALPIEEPAALPIEEPAPLAIALDQPEGLNLSQFSEAKPAAGASVDLMDQLAQQLGSAKPEGLAAPENLNWKNTDAVDTGLLKINTPEGLSATATPDGLAAPAPDVLIFKQRPPNSADGASPEGLTAGSLSASISTSISTGVSSTHDENDPTTTGADYFEFLLELKSHFSGGMILWVKNEQVKALSWDEAFKPADEKAQAYWTLSAPSAFRIAYRTKMPYLGHLVDTPTNAEFFKLWGFSAPPASVLIQPVKAEGRIRYLIVALVDPSKKSHQALSAGEKLAEKLSVFKTGSKAA